MPATTNASQVNENYTVTIMQYPTKSADPVIIQAPMPESFMYDAASQYAAPFTGGLTGNQMIDTILRVGVAARLVTQSLTAQFWQGSTDTELGLEIEFQAERDPDAEVRQQVLKLLRLTTPSTDRGGLITSPGPKFSKEAVETIIADAKKGLQEGWNKANQITNPGSTQTQQSTGSGENIPGTGPGLNGSFTRDPNLGEGQQKTTSMQDPSATITNGSQNSAANQDPSANPEFGTPDYFNNLINDRISIKIGNYLFFNSVVVTNVQTTFESQFDIYGMPHYARVSVRFKPLFMITQNDLTKIFLGPGQAAGQGQKPNITIGGTPPFVGGTARGSLDGLYSPSAANSQGASVENPVEVLPVNTNSTITTAELPPPSSAWPVPANANVG